MIILNRDEAQQVLDALAFSVPQGYGATEIYRDSVALLDAKLSAPEPVLVPPHEFIAAATGKENLIGMPIIWAEWPMREER